MKLNPQTCLAVATIGAQPPFPASRFMATVQVAVFEAVNAITGDYEPYLGTVTAPPGASTEAAAVAAVHGVLKPSSRCKAQPWINSGPLRWRRFHTDRPRTTASPSANERREFVQRGLIAGAPILQQLSYLM